VACPSDSGLRSDASGLVRPRWSRVDRGIIVFLTRYWRRAFYLLAIGFALAQLIAFIVLNGPINPMAITAKTAEAVFVIIAAYLYVNTQSGATSAG
jgi:hypothetical protein